MDDLMPRNGHGRGGAASDAAVGGGSGGADGADPATPADPPGAGDPTANGAQRADGQDRRPVVVSPSSSSPSSLPSGRQQSADTRG
jgi:hypothetical protein